MENTFGQSIVELLSDPSFASILEAKKSEGLKKWAIRKMGESYNGYIWIAEHEFLIAVVAWMNLTGLDLCTAAQVVPFRVADNPNKKPVLVDPLTLFQECERVYSRVDKIKRRKWKNRANLLLTLAENLPGVDSERAKRYVTLKASDVALDYIQRKYNLPIGTEALKKRFIPLRHLDRVPQIMMQISEIDEDGKERILDLSVKPRNTHQDLLPCNSDHLIPSCLHLTQKIRSYENLEA